MGFEARLSAAGAQGLAEFEGGPTMIAVAGGSFQMGSRGEVLTERSWWEVELPALHAPDGPPDHFTPMEWEEVRHRGPYNERPQHEVTVPPFALGKFVATLAEWDAGVADGFCRALESSDAAGGDRARRPAVGVSWDDVTGADGAAKGFLRWLNWKATGDAEAGLYRLPTEAEWEFAARAGSEAQYPFSRDESAADAYAWHAKNIGPGVRPVGEKRPNGWGFHDMFGNVGEWVQDCWRYNYVGAPRDGSIARTAEDGGDCSAAAIRGRTTFPCSIGPAARWASLRDRRMRSVGFRVARGLRDAPAQ